MCDLAFQSLLWFMSISHDCFNFQGVSWFHMNLKLPLLFMWEKKVPGILIEFALDLCVTFNIMNILTKLILPIHNHSFAFHLFVSFQFYFINIL